MSDRGRTVAELGEHALLDRLCRITRGRFGHVRIGPGDDAAWLGIPNCVVSTDTLVEDVDFRLRWASWADVGHKAAAVNLSDLSGMGARPRALLVSLCLRPKDPVQGVMSLVRSAHRLGCRYGAPVVGGDLSRTSGPLVVSAVAIGEADAPPMRRGQARLGEAVFVSGQPGEARAGLLALERAVLVPRSIVQRQLRPTPRVALGRALARSGLVTSCADVSDGLLQDAQHLVRPGLQVALDDAALPMSAPLRRAAATLGQEPGSWVREGGEDFELVFSAPAQHSHRLAALGRRVGVAVHRIGTVMRGRAGAHGHDHFRDTSSVRDLL